MRRRSFLGAIGAAALAGCTAPDSASDAPPQDGATEPTYDLAVEHPPVGGNWTAPDAPPNTDVRTETVLTGLEIPWDLSFAPNGDLFITERPGRLLRYESGALTEVAAPEDIVDASAIDIDEEGGWWATGGEGGLMGNAVHPNYPEVPLVYVTYTYRGEDGDLNKLVAYDVSREDPMPRVLIENIPGESYHNGSRVEFGPSNYLWMTTGDAGDPGLAADPSSLAGKVLRLEPDGSAPDDNPGVGDPRVYTFGHRNPQAIAFLPDGTPVVTEHGPGAYDEVNVLQPGENYGWAPQGERGRNADTYPGTEYARPVVNTSPGATWAPSGAVFYAGGGVPSWRNRLVVAGLHSQRLNVVTLHPTGDTPVPTGEHGNRFDADWMDGSYDAVHHTALSDDLGRIRHAEEGPDGALYAVTSNRDGRAEGFPVEGDDRIVRIVP